MKKKKRNPDFMFIRRMFTSVSNPIENLFQWECAYGMISLYSFKHKDREGVLELEKISMKTMQSLPKKNYGYEEEILNIHHKKLAV